jgi:glycosyltransferase involved in cell wall biosynthesis
MTGRNPGLATTQGEILADKFSELGYSTVSVSGSSNRYVRLADIILTLIRRRREIDVQCLQVYGGRSFVVEDIASLLGTRLGHRIVMLLHGGAMPEFMTRFPNWSCRVLSRAHAIVTPSAYLSKAIEKFGFRGRTIPNFIDCYKYPYRYRTSLSPHLIWMRAFHSIYNPEMALQVLSLVQRVFPSAKLTLAGPDKGSLMAMRRLAKELGVDEAVRFPGFLNMEAKIREGGANDIYLNTNKIDNMPVSVLEMGAMGLPVVTTAVGGIPDFLVNCETGLLVPDNDDEAMAKAVKRLLDDPELAGRLSASGRRLAERFSWEQVGPQWEQLFSEVQSIRRGAIG